MTIRVLLADDQTLVRAGFRVLLERADDVTVVGEAADGAEAVDRALATAPDVVLMDVRMPVMDGLEATRRITADERLAGVRVVVLTTFELDEYVFEAIRAGPSGFLLKDDVEPDDLRAAVRVVARGEAMLSPSVTRRLGRRAGRAAAAHGPRARGDGARRPRAQQRRDRGAALPEPGHCEDPREPGDGEARRPGPRAAGRARLRERPRAPGVPPPA